jgi:hypothetical protein
MVAETVEDRGGVARRGMHRRFQPGVRARPPKATEAVAFVEWTRFRESPDGPAGEPLKVLTEFSETTLRQCNRTRNTAIFEN